MAATLIHIKSRMLLPMADDEDDDEEEGTDPRAELVRRLLEYQRFKDAADQLERRELLTRTCSSAPQRQPKKSQRRDFVTCRVRTSNGTEAGS